MLISSQLQNMDCNSACDREALPETDRKHWEAKLDNNGQTKKNRIFL